MTGVDQVPSSDVWPRMAHVRAAALSSVVVVCGVGMLCPRGVGPIQPAYLY